MGEPVTLRDLARAAQVSITTASAALAGTGRVSASTRERVARVAVDLGYVPNLSAQYLRLGRTGTLGLHVQEQTLMGSAYFGEFLLGAAETTHGAGLDLMLMAPSSHRSPGRPPRVDGVIIADPLADDEAARRLMASDLPVVAGEICPPGLSATATVAADHAAGVVALLDHLASAGVRQPVLFGPGAVSGWGMVLAETYRSWCRAHGVEPVTRETAFRATTAGVHAATVDLLADHPEVDGVICASDIAALGVLRAAVEARRRVPADLLIAACVDAPALDATQASVTALSLRPRQLGVRCAQVLLGLVAGTAEPGPAPDLRPVDLLVRASTTR